MSRNTVAALLPSAMRMPISHDRRVKARIEQDLLVLRESIEISGIEGVDLLLGLPHVRPRLQPADVPLYLDGIVRSFVQRLWSSRRSARSHTARLETAFAPALDS
jgi:hypothetical protein